MKSVFINFALVVLLLLSACTPKDTKMYPVNVIPQPVSMEQKAGAFHLNEKTQIVILPNAKEATGAVELFVEMLQNTSGFSLQLTNQPISKNCILIDTNSEISLNPEAYTIEVSDRLVKLTGQSAKGIFMGLQTLRQLLPKEVESKEQLVTDWTIPNVTINDEPRFSWRGMHFDVSRHFFSKEYMKRFIDYMALYKMNRFHWHLTDDQGWRIEIKKYPELTEKGAFRTENNHDKACNERAKENPDMAINPAFFTEKAGKKVYGGYYTQEDIKEIVAYATKKGIMVIPEIDMPGHFKAAIDNYPGVSCFGEAGWGHTFSSPLCPGKEETFKMVEDILNEVIALFPAPYFHIGADEVEKSNWEKCKDCQARIKKEGLHDEHELQSYFVKRVEKYLNSKGKKMIGWDEILEGGMSETATMMYWRGWVPNAPIEAAKQGNDVIMTPTSHCYFDYAQNSGTLQHVYEFEPVPDGLSTEESKHILGGQANIWTEYIPSDARADYMSMPRMMALAEALWTPKEQKEWTNFFERIGNHFDRLDVMKVNYRIPDIGGLYESHVFVNTDTINLTSVISDQEIRYTTDGTIPSISSKLYEGPIVVKESMKFAARPFSKAGLGGDVLKATFTKTEYLKATKNEKAAEGLNYTYYEGSSWKGVADIGKKDKKVDTGVIGGFNLPEKAQIKKTSFAVVYSGYIKVEKDDVYTFSLLCDDAGVLWVGNEVVVDNDGMHAPSKKIGQVALSKGYHPIKLEYIEGGGGGTLKLEMLSNDGTFNEVSSKALFH